MVFKLAMAAQKQWRALSGSQLILPGIEGRGRAMSTRAPQHFTLLKQVNQLIEAAEGEPEIGFMARLLALCSLPRTNPRDRKEYVRRNGPYTLVMIAGGGEQAAIR